MCLELFSSVFSSAYNKLLEVLPMMQAPVSISNFVSMQSLVSSVVPKLFLESYDFSRKIKSELFPALFLEDSEIFFSPSASNEDTGTTVQNLGDLLLPSLLQFADIPFMLLSKSFSHGSILSLFPTDLWSSLTSSFFFSSLCDRPLTESSMWEVSVSSS